MPKVSVVIPCYNHGAYLLEALDSVAAQTFADYEIIIVNDGSTDPVTCEVLDNLDETRCRVIRTPNRGVSAARNLAIRESVGDYILPLDADDRIAPTYLVQTVAVLDRRPEVSIVTCDQRLFGDRDGVLSLPEYDPRQLLARNLLHTSSLYRRSLWEAVGGYLETMTSGWEDWDFWIAASCRETAVVKISEPLFHYRVRCDSRDNSLRVLQKFLLFLTMVKRHRVQYVHHAGFVFKELVGHLFRRKLR